MEKTGNSIILKNHFVGLHREMQPVMRNGKPTKRMKEVIVHDYADVVAYGYIIDGHEVFITDKDMNNSRNFAYVYKANGEPLTCTCQFGCYGTADHIEPYELNKATGKLVCTSTGMGGATGRGWGAMIKKVNW
jgi:hypothetical protein